MIHKHNNPETVSKSNIIDTRQYFLTEKCFEGGHQFTRISLKQYTGDSPYHFKTGHVDPTGYTKLISQNKKECVSVIYHSFHQFLFRVIPYN